MCGLNSVGRSVDKRTTVRVIVGNRHRARDDPETGIGEVADRPRRRDIEDVADRAGVVVQECPFRHHRDSRTRANDIVGRIHCHIRNLDFDGLRVRKYAVADLNIHDIFVVVVLSADIVRAFEAGRRNEGQNAGVWIDRELVEVRPGGVDDRVSQRTAVRVGRIHIENKCRVFRNAVLFAVASLDRRRIVGRVVGAVDGDGHELGRAVLRVRREACRSGYRPH